MLPLSVLTLHVPVPLLNGTSVLPLLNVPVRCGNVGHATVFLGSGFLQLVFLLYFLYGTGHTGGRPVQRFTDVRS